VFFLSKLLSAVTQPLFWLALWWLIALRVLGRGDSGRSKSLSLPIGLGMFWAGLLALGLLGFEALPHALLRPLENRYPIPQAATLDRYAGVIVLGGALENPDVYQAHGQVPMGDAAERMTVPVGLMRQHPKWTLVFSGGEGRLLTTGVSEAALAKAFYQEQGVDMSRVVLESRSRNTRENASEVATLLGERCRAPWLLVTSAWHMPRSMAEFESVGCNVTAYPVDFRTGESTPLTEYSLARSLLLWQMAIHEWLGDFVYRLTK
jgi:uncharacterized SAM-binding protein YcdF (DUF218 family)